MEGDNKMYKSNFKRNVKRHMIFKFFKLRKYFKENENIKILDVGAGNHSATRTKEIFTNCEYYGIDKCCTYANGIEDIRLMDKFYEMDLEKLGFDEIPNDYFDVIIITHVIEHLKNGDKVVVKLLDKMKRDGIIFLEWPRFKSTKFPSKKGTLNFFDDESHVRIYSLKEIYNLLLRNNMKFCEGGIRRSFRRILFFPLKALWDKINRGYVSASDFWDILGFSEYCIFKKK